jgi:Transposase IS4
VLTVTLLLLLQQCSCTPSGFVSLGWSRLRLICSRKLTSVQIEMLKRGAVLAWIGSTDDCELLAFVYCDHDRRYFISTCANIAGGDPIQHVRLRQMQPVDTYEEPEYQLITHNCPQAAQLYYAACGKIDQHKHCQQSGLSTEKKIRFKSWDKRVNLSIFSMIVVNLFLIRSVLVVE